MLFYWTVSLVVYGLAIYELVSGKLIPTRSNSGVTRDGRPLRYWIQVLWKIAVALSIAGLATYHLLPGTE